ncbi:MAG: leucine-rich repeat domain-containing protein [Ruminococcaceae bacterium]|nr:leucine-rich repeat domain-containing protein [Oscillospiraceae bacterium]
MNFWKEIIPMAALLLLLVSCDEKTFTVDVLAQGEGGAVITGETLQKIPYGEDASFQVELPADESIVQVFVDDVLTEDYTFADNILTLPDCTAPATVRVVAGNPDVKVYWETQAMSKNGGTITSNVTDGAVAAGSRVTLTAVPNEGAVFRGWTSRYSIDSGGQLLTEDEQVTVEVNDFSFYIANFDVSGMPKEEKKTPAAAPVYRGENTYTIYYHINGGDLLADDKVALETTFDTSYWSMPVAREDDGTFRKDGYILLGYSTDPSGSGEIIPPGHKYFLPSEEKLQNLYCIWQKATDTSQFLTTENDDKSLRIDVYTGSDPVVWIPRSIDGKRVKQIAPGAFTGNTTLQEVYIPSSVLEIEAGAFKDCSSLTTITLHDNLQKISTASFAGSPITTMRLRAATSPRYVDSYINFSIKFERLMLGAGGPRIVVVAGSSKYWGLDTDYMESLVDDSYTVVNYGTSVGMNILFYLEAVTSYLTEDDVLVFSPEQYGVNAHHSTGNPEIPSATFQGIASSYNLMERVDISRYSNVFEAFAEFCTWRSQTSVTKWDSYSPKLDRYGDYTGHMKTLNTEDYYGGSLGYFHFDEEAFPVEYRDNLNRALDNAAATGARVMFSYPPHNYNAITPAFRNERSYNRYNAMIDEIIHAERISDLNHYVHEGKYFDDSDYHLGIEGRKTHTKQLTDDMIAAGAVMGK